MDNICPPRTHYGAREFHGKNTAKVAISIKRIALLRGAGEATRRTCMYTIDYHTLLKFKQLLLTLSNEYTYKYRWQTAGFASDCRLYCDCINNTRIVLLLWIYVHIYLFLPHFCAFPLRPSYHNHTNDLFAHLSVNNWFIIDKCSRISVHVIAIIVHNGTHI